MSRMVDEPYFTYSTYSALTSGIQVKCPKCNRAGVVTADDEMLISMPELRPSRNPRPDGLPLRCA